MLFLLLYCIVLKIIVTCWLHECSVTINDSNHPEDYFTDYHVILSGIRMSIQQFTNNSISLISEAFTYLYSYYEIKSYFGDETEFKVYIYLIINTVKGL